jgi:hypothetical protein
MPDSLVEIGSVVSEENFFLNFIPSELLSSLFVRRPSINISHFNLLLRNHWANCNQTLWEFPIGSYVKLSLAVVAILVRGLKCRTVWLRLAQ